jgi:hypothetical protein
MAKISAKGAAISVDDSGGSPQVISSDVKSFEIEYAIDPLEVTGFGDGSKNFTPGQKVIGVTLDVFWNAAATTGAFTVLKGILGQATSVTVSITPEIGGLAFSGEFMCDGITPKGEVNGVIELGSVHFSVMGSTAPAWA